MWGKEISRISELDILRLLVPSLTHSEATVLYSHLWAVGGFTLWSVEPKKSTFRDIRPY